jgi:hypothetical protein
MLAVLNFSLEVMWKKTSASWDVPGRRVKRENLALT